jgi:hypothetical protein
MERGWSILTEFRQEPEHGRLLGTPAQRLAAIAHGDGIGTTRVTTPSLVHIRNATISAAANTTATESGGISA